MFQRASVSERQVNADAALIGQRAASQLITLHLPFQMFGRGE